METRPPNLYKQTVAFIHLPLSNKQDNKVNIWTVKSNIIYLPAFFVKEQLSSLFH